MLDPVRLYSLFGYSSLSKEHSFTWFNRPAGTILASSCAARIGSESYIAHKELKLS